MLNEGFAWARWLLTRTHFLGGLCSVLWLELLLCVRSILQTCPYPVTYLHSKGNDLVTLLAYSDKFGRLVECAEVLPEHLAVLSAHVQRRTLRREGKARARYMHTPRLVYAEIAGHK